MLNNDLSNIPIERSFIDGCEIINFIGVTDYDVRVVLMYRYLEQKYGKSIKELNPVICHTSFRVPSSKRYNIAEVILANGQEEQTYFKQYL